MTMLRIATILALVATPLFLSGCHTVHGVGEDLNSAGHAISNTASDVQKKM